MIGCGVCWDKWVFVEDGCYGVGKEFLKYGDVVVVCDVDVDCFEWVKVIVEEWYGVVFLVSGDY